MRLNTKSRYAVMALADMASFKANKPISLRDISLRQSISLMYLEQIFLKLKKHNIVQSVRGSSGGYILSKNPNNLKLSEIFLALDENVKTINCYVLPFLFTWRTPIFEGRLAADASRFPRSYKGIEEKSLARTPPEDTGKTPFHPSSTK